MAEGLHIEASELCKHYTLEGRVIPVFEAAQFVIGASETVAVVGASGSGKSTLLHLVGLLDRPSGGEIHYNGAQLLAAREDVIEEFRNRQVGFVFQFHHLLPEFTAQENVMMPAIIAGQTMTSARERATALLERVGLGARLRHAPGELSGGEQQRVALARALVMEPRLLLADEPTGNLDPKTGSQILDLLLELNDEHGTTLVLATHSMELAGRMPRCLEIADRQVRERGRPL